MILPFFRSFRIVFAALAVSALVSCASLRGFTDRVFEEDGEPVSAEAAEVMSLDEHRARLSEVVRNDLQSERDQGTEQNPQFVHRRPYFFKEYVTYPDGIEGFELEVQEQDSRTAPYEGQATVQKRRFSTTLHRNREEAQADNDFLRDTGTQVLTYEYRNGQWRRVGSLYVADRTEQFVNGEWVRVEAPPQRTVASEQSEKGWFGRMLDALQFWK